MRTDPRIHGTQREEGSNSKKQRVLGLIEGRQESDLAAQPQERLPPTACRRRGGGRGRGAAVTVPVSSSLPKNHLPRHRSSPGSGIAAVTARPGAGVTSPSSPGLASAWLLQAARTPPAASHRPFPPPPCRCK